MALQGTTRPGWLTFDYYGTLIQWDEGLTAAVKQILARRGGSGIDAQTLNKIYDGHEHRLEQTPPRRSFREITALSLQQAMTELGLRYEAEDVELLTSSISAMPPFP